MKIKLTCTICGRDFERNKGEVTRNTKLGRPHYCSLSCCGKANLKNIPIEKRNTYDISQHAGRKADDFSPFRWHLKSCITRKLDRERKKLSERPVTITLQDLKSQWELQNGKCPYTGWDLVQMPNICSCNQLPLTPNRASLDRIDSTKGYVLGNIQFIACIAQYAKNKFTTDDVMKFCESVVNFQLSHQDQKDTNENLLRN